MSLRDEGGEGANRSNPSIPVKSYHSTTTPDMSPKRFSSLIVFGLFVCQPVVQAQEPEMPAPQKEHEWLQRFVGKWESESKASTGPDQPPVECKGSIACRMLGGFWLVSEYEGDMGGMAFKGLQTIGYDPAKKKYVGTWVDSMMNHMWMYEGSVDEGGTKLVLEASGPNFMAGGKETKFRDTYAFKSADEMIITSSMLGDDGEWITFMTGTARRVE